MTCDSNVLMPKSDFYVATKEGQKKHMFFIAQKIDPAAPWGTFSVEFLSAKQVERKDEFVINQSYVLQYMSEKEIREKEEAERDELDMRGGGMRGMGY